MKQRWYAALVLLCFLISLPVSFAGSSAKKIVKEKQYKIELDTTNEQTGSTKTFEFKNDDVPVPEECKTNTNIICQEHTTITTTVHKEWTLTEVPPIWSNTLTSTDFAKYYPDLDETKTITDSSSAQSKWIVQKILYSRGLMEAKPTGKIGYQTELAIIKLQHLKGFVEMNKQKTAVVIGPKTLKALNQIKKNMQDPKYLASTPLPLVSPDDMTPTLKNRYNEITTAMKKSSPKETNTSSSSLPKIQVINPAVNGNILKFEGGASIQGNK